MSKISYRYNTESFIKKAKEVHFDIYSYESVDYKKSHSKVKILCKTHGIFEQAPSMHISGQGCPFCSKTISKPSKDWLKSLENLNIISEYQFPQNRRRKADGYDPTTNTVYQFHGTYWHSDPIVFSHELLHELAEMTHGENYAISCKKDQQILDWGYNLVVMWEYDWQLLNKSLKKTIK